MWVGLVFLHGGEESGELIERVGFYPAPDLVDVICFEGEGCDDAWLMISRLPESCQIMPLTEIVGAPLSSP